MRYYLGIDGGGTKTTALLCDETGTEISRFVGEELNYCAVGMETARAHLRAVVSGVLAERDILPDAVCIGLSAIFGRADAALTRAFCAEILPPERVLLDNDLFIALETMETDGPAAVAVAGTGSMAVGRLPDGTLLHTGGWGHLLGDEGSGYALARESVRAVLSAAENRGDATALTRAAFAYFRVSDPDGLVDRFYAPDCPRSTVAGFAPSVFACAAAGDPVAVRILRAQAAAFSETVSALLRRIPAGTPLGLWGGVFENQPEFVSAFSETVRKEFPQTRVGLLPRAPVWGAIRAAKRFFETKSAAEGKE